MPTAAPSFPALNATDFASGQAFNVLPPGDTLMTVDVGTLLNQTIPTALQGSPDQQAKFDAQLKEFQQKSGIDPKQIKLMALSAKLPKGGGKGEFVAVMTGTFDTARVTESLAKDPETGAPVAAETYGETSIYVHRRGTDEMATAVLDSSTIILGSPSAAVRQAIDARADKAPDATTNAELFGTFKETRETGLLRFAIAVPPDAAPAQSNDPMTLALSRARYAFGALDATSGLALDITARTDGPDQAKPLYDQLTQNIEAGKKAVSGNEQLKGFQTILESTTVTQADRDVKMTTALSPITLLIVYDQFQKMSMGAAPPPATTPGGNANVNR